MRRNLEFKNFSPGHRLRELVKDLIARHDAEDAVREVFTEIERQLEKRQETARWLPCRECGAARSRCATSRTWSAPVLIACSKYIRLFQSLRREHLFFQPSVEANVF
jgi:hypothetical protein